MIELNELDSPSLTGISHSTSIDQYKAEIPIKNK